MEKNEFEKKKNVFIFRLHCDLAEHICKFNKAVMYFNLFSVIRERSIIKYIEKLIIKAEGDLS